MKHQIKWPDWWTANCKLDVLFLNVPRPVVPGGAMAPPDFGRSVNPISTGVGTDYAYQIILAFPDFQTFLRPWFLNSWPNKFANNQPRKGEKTPWFYLWIIGIRINDWPVCLYFLRIILNAKTPGLKYLETLSTF